MFIMDGRMTEIKSASGIFREASWKSVTYQSTVFGDLFFSCFLIKHSIH